MKDLLVVVTLAFLAGNAPDDALSQSRCDDYSPQQATVTIHRLCIVPASGIMRYNISCEDCKYDMNNNGEKVYVRRGDFLVWTNRLNQDVVLEFYGSTTNESRPLILFACEAQNIIVRKNDETWMRVRMDADYRVDKATENTINKHVYRVRGFDPTDPPPGVIVCPPTGPCP